MIRFIFISSICTLINSYLLISFALISQALTFLEAP